MIEQKFSHEQLDVYRVALDFVAVAFALAQALPPGSAFLSDQLRRASTSIVLNIAEGAGEFSPGDKARFYRMAQRSATECAAILDVGTRCGLLASEQVSEGRGLLIRAVAMLAKLSKAQGRPVSGMISETGTITETGTGMGTETGTPHA